jgi:hypothetical protein
MIMAQRLALLLPVLLSGCASIVSGADHRIHVDSDPKGAKVTLLGNYMGETPLTVSIPRRGWGVESAPRPDNPTLVLELQGYAPAMIELRRYTNPAIFLNLMNLFLGLIVDGITGAYWEFWPDQALVKMNPLPPGK